MDNCNLKVELEIHCQDLGPSISHFLSSTRRDSF